MASTAFSIRRYAGTMRVQPAAEGRRPLSIVDLPPIEAPRDRWWMDELASAVAAAAAAVPRSPGKATSAKKRPISDLFSAAPLLDVAPAVDSGCNGQAEANGEAMSAIVKRARENCKSRLQAELNDEEAAAAATPEERSGEPERNFLATKEVLGSQNLPDGLDTHPSQKPEASQHHRKEREKIFGMRKQGKIDNTKKADTEKCIDNDQADKVGKTGDLGKFLPGQGILTYTRRASVKMAKEKHGNSKDKEVIELCGKSVHHVKFSEANAVHGSKMNSSEIPKRRSLCNLFADAMASSSSSSSALMEEDKYAAVEGTTSSMPKETLTKTKEPNKHYNHDDSAQHSKREMSAPLIDLNMAPPECTDTEWTYDSNLQRLGSQPPAANLERVRSLGSSGTFFHGEPIKASDTDVVAPSTFRLMGKDVCTTRGESSAQTPQKYRADVFSGDRLSYENRYGDFSNSQANQTQLLGCPPLPNHGSVALQNSPPLPTAPVFHANLPRQQVVHSTSSSVCHLNSVSYTLCHPGQVVQYISNSTGDEALFSRNPGNETGRAVPDNSSSGGDVQERS